MKRYLVAFFVSAYIMLPILTNTGVASAHRSGCHRWHSCPSDSGSYTCGDTGHSNYCGESTYTAPTPTYYEQGQTNGKAHAEKDRLALTSSAKSSGYSTGYDDGKLGRDKSYYLLAPETLCSRSFTFATGSSALYTSSYESSYKSNCETIVNTVYKSSYSEGYSEGLKYKNANILGESIEKKPSTNSNRSDSSLWWLLAPATFIGIPVLGASWDGIKKWVNS